MAIPSRFVVALPLVLVASAACSSSQDEATGGVSAAVKSGACSASRDEILSATSAMRAHAIERGFGWLDANVPYSQSASHGGYRTDCSGFVSMCWELGTSTNTGALVSSTTYASKLSSWDALLPADALLRQGHVMLFVGWEPGKSSVCVLEQASTASDMQFRVKSVASLESQGFKPIRAKKLAAATGTATGGDTAPDTGAEADPTGTTPADPTPADATPADATPAHPTPAGPTTCVSRSASAVCGEAAADGVECGPVIDECGRSVTCDGVAGFGCATGEKCTATQQCIPAAAAPPATPPSTTTTTPPTDPPLGDTLPAPGDTGDIASPSEGDPTANTTSSKASRSAAAPTASSGCSVSSPTGSRDGLHLLGVVVALGVLRRRKRAVR